MAVNGTRFVKMGQNRLESIKWIHRGPHWSKRVNIGPNRFKLILIGLNRSKKINMISYGIIWSKIVHIFTKNYTNGSGITRSPGLV